MQRRLAAILASDVVGFSRLTEQDDEGALARLGAVRERIVNPNVANSSGRVVKLIGDGALMEFPSVVDAVRCAIAIQGALVQDNAGEPIGRRIVLRIGINLGDVIVQGDDLYGDGVNIAARLEQLAEPGGIAISGSVRDQIGAKFGELFEPMGAQELKNISRPIDVWRWVGAEQSGHGTAQPEEKSKPAPDGPPPNNLPLQLSSFVGRARELSELRALLADTRLLTLTGAGGSGKTRLACQIGADALRDFPEGVWFVALASLRDPALLAQAVATVLGIREQPGRPLSDTIREHLASRSALLILDNCEQILSDCARFAEGLLQVCPELTVLATSREALGVNGEQVHLVSGLAAPRPQETHSADTLSRFEAVQLFADRARLRSRTFELTEANADVVAGICTRLDGIPLAIELAAARVRVLSVQQIADRLDDAFRLLNDGSRTGLSHHQTLRLAMDWSYGMLSDEEASLFRRLSIFAGSFSLEAVEAICVDGHDHAFDPLDLLQRLVEKSTVVAEHHGDETRYRLLETIRQYAQEKLDKDPGLSALRHRHIECFLALAEAAEPEIQGAGGGEAQAVWLDKLEADHSNLRAALQYGATAAREASTVALAGALWRFWEVRGHLSEGREALRGALAIGLDAAPALRAKAIDGAGRLAWRQGDFEDAHTCFTESLALWREAGDATGEANALHGLARTALNLVDFPTARDSAEASLAIHRQIGNDQGIASAINTLGEVARAEGDFDGAETFYTKSLTIFRGVGDIAASVSVLHNLGYTALNRQEITKAKAIFCEALVIARDLNDRLGIFSMLGGLACVAAAAGQAERALELFGAAEGVGKSWGYAGDRIDQEEINRWALAARSMTGDGASVYIWERGQRMEPDAAMDLALN